MRTEYNFRITNNWTGKQDILHFGSKKYANDYYLKHIDIWKKHKEKLKVECIESHWNGNSLHDYKVVKTVNA